MPSPPRRAGNSRRALSWSVIPSAFGSYASYYRVGTVDVTYRTITWGPSLPYGVGKGLAVAVNNAGAVVEVHKSSQLEYRLGQLNRENQTIS